MDAVTPSASLTLSIEQLIVALEYRNSARLPSLPLDEFAQLEPRDRRLLRAAARRSLQARALLSYRDGAEATLAEPLQSLLDDCLRSPICDSVIVQSAEASSLTACYRVEDGCIAHTALPDSLHRLSRHPAQTSRDFAHHAVGSIAEPPATAPVTLPRALFGAAEQPLPPDELTAALVPHLPAAAINALTAPSRIVALQRAVARRDEAPVVNSLAFHWSGDACWVLQPSADRTALQVTPLSPAALTPLIDAHFS
jgi:hypothetical protein